MVNVNTNQPFTGSGVISSSMKADWDKAIDTILYDLGRNITIHLQPQQKPCPSNCNYNSVYDATVGPNNTVCRTCGGRGHIYVTREAIYKANITWRNVEFDDEGRPLTVPVKRVVTKTFDTSLTHIKRSVGATIDGIKCEKVEDPTLRGFGSNRYVKTIWQEEGK